MSPFAIPALLEATNWLMHLVDLGLMENIRSPMRDGGTDGGIDRESEIRLTQMAEQDDIVANRLTGVKFVLLVLSSRGMVYDLESLRQKIILSYPDSAIFFRTTDGEPIGAESPKKVDLLIDFTGPGQRQGFLYAHRLRSKARFAVGRNAGWFRKRIYDRVYDETRDDSNIPDETLKKERFVQKKVLNLAGIAFVQAGDTPSDLGKTIALDLPGIQNLK